MARELSIIFICVVLPVAVVLINALSKINEDNKRAQILIKAIESNKDIDTDKLIEATKKVSKAPREILNSRLLRGCIFSFIGVALAIIGFSNLAIGADFHEDPVTVPLVFGSISLAIGVSYLIVCNVMRKQIDSSENK